jgi:hypothetical protein
VFASTDLLRALVDRATDHALPSAGEGFHVFVMTEGGAGPQFVRFISSVADGMTQARLYVTSGRLQIDRYAVACDGTITRDGAHSAAVLIEAGERGNRAAGRYGLRYRPRNGDIGPIADGDRVLLETLPNPLAPSTEATIVECFHCKLKNRVNLQRLATQNARCGSCKKPLHT